MESFDLLKASAFLPVMDNTENVTKQLISSTLMYNSLLNEESKSILINFILTTRLTDNAKLRLSKQYNTVEQLLDDMNKHLLTKKSFTSIQQQLLGCKQNDKTIDAYGKEIEDLFVELTIAQADGDQNKQNILQPINEKTAINRFATGLKNSRLSALIAARTYDNLKLAIRDAKDEDAAMSVGSTKSSDNKQLLNNNMSGVNWGHGRGGYSQRGHAPPSERGHGPPTQCGRGYLGRGGHYQPSYRGHSQPSYHGPSQPIHSGHTQPSAHHQPSQRGHSQPSHRGHGQPSQRGHGQPSRGNYHGANNNHNKTNNHGESNSGKNNASPQIKVETQVVVTTKTTTSIAKNSECNKNNNPPKSTGPKNNNPQKPTGQKHNNPSKDSAPKNNNPQKNTSHPKNNKK